MVLSVTLWVIGALLVAAVLVVGYYVAKTGRIAAESERLVPPIGKFVDVDGNRVHYVDSGEGLPILFLHGLGGQLHHFRHTLFGRFGPGYRLVALDRPGSGYSVRASGSLSEQAQAIARFIERIGLDRPLVVGHSLGGAIALTLAVEHPRAISGLALLSPLTHLETEVRREFKSLYIPSRLKRWAIAQTTAVPTSLKYAAQTLGFVFGPQAIPQDYGIAAGGWLGLRPSHFYATATDIVAIQNDLGRIEDRYGEIAMPAGILFGTADRVIAFDVHGEPMTRKIRNLDFEQVEGLGHMPQFVETERVLAFIKRIAGRAFAAHRQDRSLPGSRFYH